MKVVKPAKGKHLLAIIRHGERADWAPNAS